MGVVRTVRRWWVRQRTINPGRVASWLVSIITVIATAILVAVAVRLAG